MTPRTAAAIPIARPQIGEEEKRQVQDVLDSGILVAGPRVAAFEAAFAAYLGVPHAIATASGSSALQVAMLALGIGPGDRVLTTPFTFSASSNAVIHAGAHPVFADVDPATCNLDPEAVEPVLRRGGIRAILVVHLYGLPADMRAFRDLARRYGALLVEDCAQAHGAAIDGRRVGTFGDAAVFSFYPTKNMTTGEGGMVVTADAAVARRARLLVDPRGETEYAYEVIGFNYRMTEIAAAIGLVQLAALEERNERRRANARWLSDGLQDVPWLRVPREPAGFRHVYHQYTLRVFAQREALIRHLEAHGIASRVYYPSVIPHTPAYRHRGFEGRYPQAERLTREVLSVPVHPSLRPDELEAIVRAVRAFPGAAA
ncbi:MAG: DegT/DnrJ/EryC1/StrS family aminotransferase [Armatimonadota bacterium]|nr:DegT/DnrJ/EryC1/StrS family aminotransferase [Armatimonadota bacterium]MDR7518663.1 DegT/DnrJ/EryC1/StrS family aminotransferase [Armatimonadota bacterium]MDR7549854.1 DegT/DnrJ/EryC1/StrS family aminotransferase [Armatimonadota bacterium]